MGMSDEIVDAASRSVVLATVVSVSMSDEMAHDRGFKPCRALAGIKYLGEQVGLPERMGADRFWFVFEELFGYLSVSYLGAEGSDRMAPLCPGCAWSRPRK